MVQRGEHFAINQFVGFMKDVAALRMAEDDVGHAVRVQHRRRHFAGERAFFFVMHVLRAQQNGRAGERLRDGRDQDRGRRNHHVPILRQRCGVAIDLGADALDQGACADRQQMHLPVPGD